jgi:transcriptional antiterminator Rof (Rho-off)
MRSHDEFATRFWRAAARSLHPTVRERYLPQLKAAERWELALDAAVEAFSRARKLLAGLFQAAPRSRSAH